MNASPAVVRPNEVAIFVVDHRSVKAGLPLEVISTLVDGFGLSMTDIYEVVIAARTLKHRRARKEPLSIEESDRLARLLRIVTFANKVFGNPEKALRWLGNPKHQLDGETPLRMLVTEVGGHQVQDLLGQIQHGIFG